MKIKYLITLSIIISVFLSSCSGESVKENPETKAINANIEIAKFNPQAQQLSYSGKVEAAQFATISTRISGNITNILVKPGQKVKKNELLIKISNKDLLAQKAQIKSAQEKAKTAFNIAEKDLKRYETLYKQKSASEKEVENIQSQYTMTKANLEVALSKENEINEAISYSQIKAPFSGIITKKFVNIGELANPGTPLIGIEKQASFNVIANIPESDINQLQIGDQVLVSIKSANLYQIKAIITELNPSTQHSINQYELKLQIDTKNQKDLRSGMFANVIIKRNPVDCITIPKEALVYKGQLTGVYAVSTSNTALLRWVRTGKTNGDQIEILSGLTEGEKYIRSYQGKIWDGAKLNINK